MTDVDITVVLSGHLKLVGRCGGEGPINGQLWVPAFSTMLLMPGHNHHAPGSSLVEAPSIGSGQRGMGVENYPVPHSPLILLFLSWETELTCPSSSLCKSPSQDRVMPSGLPLPRIPIGVWLNPWGTNSILWTLFLLLPPFPTPGMEIPDSWLSDSCPSDKQLSLTGWCFD